MVFRFSTPSKQIPPAMGCLRRLFSRESRQPTAGQGCSSFKSLGVVRNPQGHTHSMLKEFVLLRCSGSVKLTSCKLSAIKVKAYPNSSLPFFLQCIPVVLQQTKCIYTGPGDFYIHMYPLNILVSNSIYDIGVYVYKLYYNIIMYNHPTSPFKTAT